MSDRETNREALAREAIRKIPQGNRLVLLMHYVDALTPEEIAAVLVGMEGVTPRQRRQLQVRPGRAVAAIHAETMQLLRAAVLGKVISPNCPTDGREWENQCGRCGSSMDWTECDQCEDGYSHHDCGEDTCCCLDPEPNVVCDICHGKGGWWGCLSSPEWCEAHPCKGHDNVKRGEIEWFVVEVP